MTASLDRAAAFDRLRQIVGPAGWVEAPEALAPYLKEWRGKYQGQSRLALRPADTGAMAACVAVCAGAGIAMVPQGGNTGLVGGAVGGADEVILATDRMTRIRAVDPLNHTITVEAGAILQDIQTAAEAADRLFPLSLGAQGSCRIGGNLSTNAGGTNVLRYGSARDLVLGLEVVLPDGQIWDGLRALRKDNTGYDLKQLFIGAEGTLGIVTAAVLKLFPRPRQMETAFIAVRDPDAAVELLSRARADAGDTVTGCELIPRIAIDFARRHVAGTVDPLPGEHDWFLLLELSSGAAAFSLRPGLEALLERGFEDGLVRDATLAATLEQGQKLWHLREAIVEAQLYEGGSIKHDISVPVSSVGAFLREALAAVERAVPGIRAVPFGHVGDGNIHFNLSQPEGADRAAYLARWEDINHLVHDIVVAHGGSISAEHGIGLLKRDELAARKSPLEADLMRRIKQAFDPAGLMNPGKLLPVGRH